MFLWFNVQIAGSFSQQLFQNALTFTMNSRFVFIVKKVHLQELGPTKYKDDGGYTGRPKKSYPDFWQKKFEEVNFSLASHVSSLLVTKKGIT